MAVLSDDEKKLVASLQGQIRRNRRRYLLLDRYYEGEQRIEQIGLAVPPELRMFKAAVNVPRMAVNEVVSRQNLKGFQRSGKPAIDGTLRDAWELNNLTSRSMLLHLDTRLYGRGFVSVSANPDDSKMPLVTVEPAESMAIDVSPLGQTRAAGREYSDGSDRFFTLYQPGVTRWLKRSRNGWEDLEEPDTHEIGRAHV